LAAEKAYQPWGREHPDADDVVEIGLGQEWVQLYRSHYTRAEGVGDRFLTLLTSSCAVLLTGQGLGELRRLLRANKVGFIEEYDVRRWPALAPGVPVIERVEVIYAEDSLGETATASRPAT
jgi:hypothetical protein